MIAGFNTPLKSPKTPKKKGPSLILVVGLAVLAFVLIAAIWCLSRSKAPQVEEPEKPKLIKDAPLKKIPKIKQESIDDPKWEGLDKTRIKKAANGKLVYLPRFGEERFPGERAQALALIGGTNNTVAIDKRLVEDPDHPWMFHNMLQSDIVQYARPGEFAVPVNPNITDKEAWEAVNTPIEFHFNDSDTQLEEKQMVKDFMKELKEYLEEGGHARDYFAELHSRQEQEAEIMLKTRQEVHDILNTGDVEGAKAALNAYNAYRKEKGLPPMRVRKLNVPTPEPEE